MSAPLKGPEGEDRDRERAPGTACDQRGSWLDPVADDAVPHVELLAAAVAWP